MQAAKIALNMQSKNRSLHCQSHWTTTFRLCKFVYKVLTILIYIIQHKIPTCGTVFRWERISRSDNCYFLTQWQTDWKLTVLYLLVYSLITPFIWLVVCIGIGIGIGIWIGIGIFIRNQIFWTALICNACIHWNLENIFKNHCQIHSHTLSTTQRPLPLMWAEW